MSAASNAGDSWTRLRAVGEDPFAIRRDLRNDGADPGVIVRLILRRERDLIAVADGDADVH
jgi:hypothetical protein